MPRLFTGLEIPEPLAEELALLRGGVMGARWLDTENYHLTLRFIGDIDEGQADEVFHTLGQIRRKPFEVTLDALDSFGGDKPRAIVARAQPNQALVELQAEQDRLIKRLGIPPEPRKFKPHVTLAWLRAASAWAVADYISSRGLFLLRRFPVERFVIFSSRASTGGGPYVVEAAYPLG